ncbi:MAG: hypothetical protein LBD33_00010 [Puniceicoccales bacterium]|jgi:hypothetical protein|nr:hypothetical protein [Puniceicoccales bacterium]
MRVLTNPGFFARSTCFYKDKRSTIGAFENDAQQFASTLKRKWGAAKFNAALRNAESIARRSVEIILNPQSKDSDISGIVQDILEKFSALTPSKAQVGEFKKLLGTGVLVAIQFRRNVITGYSHPGEDIVRMAKEQLILNLRRQ